MSPEELLELEIQRLLTAEFVAKCIAEYYESLRIKDETNE